MTFALRGLWVVSPYESLPFFERQFISVETRAKKISNYIAVPESETFVDALLIETGVKKSDSFVTSRDGCERTCWAPAFELPCSASGNLGPVVVLQHRGLLLCGLPLSKWAPGSELSSFHDVAQTMDCLNMLSEILNGDISQRSNVRLQLTRFVAEALPFGRPMCLSSSLSEQLLSAGARDTVLDKVKQPVWNPSTTKGKSQLYFQITEQVHCKMPKKENGGKALISGTVWVTVGEIAGISPEVNLTLVHPSRLLSLTLAPRAKTTVQSNEATTLTFSPSPTSRTALCHYTMACELLPIEGVLSIKEAGVDGQAKLKLVLQSTRAAVQRLDVTLCPSVGQMRVLKASVGIAVEEGTGLHWDVPPSKLKSRPAQLEASIPEPESTDEIRNLQCHAQISFKIADQTWSGCKVLPQSVTTSVPSSKVKSSFSAETSSGHYRIFSECSST